MLMRSTASPMKTAVIAPLTSMVMLLVACSNARSAEDANLLPESDPHRLDDTLESSGPHDGAAERGEPSGSGGGETEHGEFSSSDGGGTEDGELSSSDGGGTEGDAPSSSDDDVAEDGEPRSSDGGSQSGGAKPWSEWVVLVERGSAPAESARAKVLRALEPIFVAFREEARVAGATFRLELNWNDTSASAGAAPNSGRIWDIVVGGGFADVAQDAITFTVCHEMGHILGGFPFMNGDGPHTEDERAEYGTVLSAEGQADYFTTKECLPRVWGSDDNSVYEHLAPELKDRCDEAYGDVLDRQLCYRILSSSLDQASSFAPYANNSYTPEVCDEEDLWDTEWDCENFLEPTATSRPKVEEPAITTFGYPTRVCRLETYVRGALCPIKAPRPSETGGELVIPGYVETPWGYGVVSEESRAAAAPYACHGDHPGARPSCWYNEDVPLRSSSNSLP